MSTLDHLKWAIDSRARNQRCALKLLKLFKEHSKQWSTKAWSRAAQELLAASFSLWRAAFLADKTAKRAEVFQDAIEFLEKIIEDNAISYAQDKQCKEWTFNYYTKNARAALIALNENWPVEVPKYVNSNRKPVERWDYCQNLLDSAVEGFERLASARKAKKVARKEVVERRRAAKIRKQKSRAFTLSQKAANPLAINTSQP